MKDVKQDLCETCGIGIEKGEKLCDGCKDYLNVDKKVPQDKKGWGRSYGYPKVDKGEKNPAHDCLSCNKYLGFRGFCSEDCHNQYYDREAESVDKGEQEGDKR